MWDEIIIWLFLSYTGICDIKIRKINAIVCVVFGMVGLGLFAIGNGKSVLSLAGGILCGAGLMIFSKLTKEAVGMGDGYVVAAVGIWAGGEKTLATLMGALFLAAGFGILWICTGRANGKTEIAFVPFFTLSYMLLTLGKMI